MKSLKIALLGYGKMGKEIEKAALGRNHSIIAVIDKEQDWRKEESRLAQADAAIDFSTPSAAPGNIGRCFDLHIPIVVGTTGWDKEMPAIRERCLAEGQSLFQKRGKIDTKVDIIRQCVDEQRLLHGAPRRFLHFVPKAVDFEKAKILRQRIFRNARIFV